MWLDTLKQHVIGAWGQKGEQWLAQLPEIVAHLTDQWQLSDVQPIDFPSYNYVAFCDRGDGEPVVLKISCDAQLIADEYRTHKHFNGQGAVKVLVYDTEYHAVLLERAVPGDVLSAIDRDRAIPVFSHIVQQLLSCEQSDQQLYDTVERLLKTLDRITSPLIERKYIDCGYALAKTIQDNPEKKYICHGDLHLGNIILHGDNYLAIDPKGVIAEKGYEISSFDLLTAEEITANKNIPALIQTRIQALAEALKVDEQRLCAWFYLRTLMSAQWFIEDQGDPSQRLYLLQYLYDFYQGT